MMTTNEMKKILADKFANEGCGFTFKDISIKKVKDNYYHISIKDYTHITFLMTFEQDNYFGYCVFINEEWENDITNVVFIDSKYKYEIKNALLHLGYHIANTF